MTVSLRISVDFQHKLGIIYFVNHGRGQKRSLIVAYNNQKLIKEFITFDELFAINTKCRYPTKVSYQLALTRRQEQRSDKRYKQKHQRQGWEMGTGSNGPDVMAMPGILKQVGCTPKQIQACSFWVAGYSQAEIGDQLNVSVQAVSQLIKRARVKIDKYNADKELVEDLLRLTGRIT